jgi:hypothetical protein
MLRVAERERRRGRERALGQTVDTTAMAQCPNAIAEKTHSEKCGTIGNRKYF